MIAGRKARRERQDGAALLLVLWISGLFALLVAGFTAAVRSDAGLAHNAMERVRVEALQEAGLAAAVLGLQHPEETRWQADARPYAVSLGGGKVTVRVIDQNGLVDLNKAPDELILGILAIGGLEPDDAEGVLAALQDWRDEDDDRRDGGAEGIDYRRASLGYDPANAPFLAPAELEQVMGVPAGLFRRIGDGLTTYSRQGLLNPLTAPPVALAALPGMTARDLQDVLTLRHRPDPETAVRDRLQYASAYLTEEVGPFYGLRLEAETRGGFRAAAEAVVWIGEQQGLYSVAEWRQRAWPAPQEGAGG